MELSEGEGGGGGINQVGGTGSSRRTNQVAQSNSFNHLLVRLLLAQRNSFNDKYSNTRERIQ